MPSGFALWFLIMASGSLVFEWLNSAMSDGKVTLTEVADLIEKLGRLWNFKVELDMPAPQLRFEDDERAEYSPGAETDLEPKRTPPKVE